MIRVTGNNSLLMSSLNTDRTMIQKGGLVKKSSETEKSSKITGKKRKNMTVSRSLHPHSKQVQQY